MSKLTERLAKKIQEDLGIETDPNTFISIKPNPFYKAAGAWSWEMSTTGPHHAKSIRKVGSMWPAKECVLKSVKLSAIESNRFGFSNELELIPEEKLWIK